MAISYNTARVNATNIYRATSGGTVFSSNLYNQTAFDYFTDTAVANDAIYFCCNGSNVAWSNLYLTVGTPMAGTDIVLVWEYYCASTGTWRTCHGLTDGSNGFTTTGAVTVVFPFQVNWRHTTVNGVSKSWVRCRIVSLTAITEGGANSTTVVKGSDGSININSYTDASPCTFTEMYNWVIANAPEIGATKIGNNSFKFDNCKLTISSTLRTTNETIFFGNGCYYQSFNFSYLWSGTKVGTNGWSNPSYFFFSTYGPTNIISFSTNTRVYGGLMSPSQFSNVVDGLNCINGGYCGPSYGEHIGVYYPRGGYFTSGVVDRCIFEGGLITAAKPSVYPTNMQISNPSNIIWSIYGNEMDASNVTYALPTSSIISPSQQYTPVSSSYNINITNPNPALPLQTETPKVISRFLGTLTNPTNVLFYDDSAGTYTDYTTPATNTTVDDVPINGDVGDILYMKLGTVFLPGGYSPALTFTITDQSNNYVYAWEYISSSTGLWVTLDSSFIFDNTDNLTKTGVIYFATGQLFSGSGVVNSITGSWLRCRIVTKGTGTPTLTRIQYRTQLGLWLTSINEKYTTQITIKDVNGDAIEGATITLTDALGVITSFTTDVNGQTTSTDIITNVTKFDKDVSETYSNYATVTKNPYTIKVMKDGYQTYNEILSITSITNKTIALEKIPTAIYMLDINP